MSRTRGPEWQPGWQSMPGGRAGNDGAWVLLVALDSRRADLYVQLFAEDCTTPLAEPAAVLPDRLASYVGGLIGGARLLVAGDLAELPPQCSERRSGRIARSARCPNSAPDALGVAAAALLARGNRRGGRAGAAALPAPPGRDAAEREKSRPGRRAMSLRIAPIPDGAAEPLALMHRACFPEDPWDAGAFARIFALHGVFGYLAWFDDAATGKPRATMPWPASFWRATSAAKPRS